MRSTPSRFVLFSLLMSVACAEAPESPMSEPEVDDVDAGSIEESEHALTRAPTPTCGSVCTPTVSCTKGCFTDFTREELATCGAWGQCAGADPDGDGIASNSDNCPNQANPNQRNCDGDAYGDVCDASSSLYAQTATYYCVSAPLIPQSVPNGYILYVQSSPILTDQSSCGAPEKLGSAKSSQLTCSNGTSPANCCAQAFSSVAQDLLALCGDLDIAGHGGCSRSK